MPTRNAIHITDTHPTHERPVHTIRAIPTPGGQPERLPAIETAFTSSILFPVESNMVGSEEGLMDLTHLAMVEGFLCGYRNMIALFYSHTPANEYVESCSRMRRGLASSMTGLYTTLFNVKSDEATRMTVAWSTGYTQGYECAYEWYNNQI